MTDAQTLGVKTKALQDGQNALNERDEDDGLDILVANSKGDTDAVAAKALAIIRRNRGLSKVGEALVNDNLTTAEKRMMDLMARERREASAKTQ